MKYRLLLLLLLLPLFMIEIGNSHDWGDDFSQYLLQAKSINEHKSQVNNELVFSTGELPYAIVAYPVGFPMILAPVFSTFGLYIPPYLYLNCVFVLLTTLLLFEYSKKRFDVTKSLLIAIFFAYSLISIVLKKEILSEFPFTLVLLCIVLLVKTGNRKSFLFGGLLAGVLISIRMTGIVILPAIFGWQLLTQRHLKVSEKLLNCLVFFALAMSTFWILNVAIFQIDLPNFFHFYAAQIGSNRLMLPSGFLSFFEKTGESFFPPFSSLILSLSTMIVVIIGFAKKFRDVNLADWFFLFYLFVIILYPYSSSGYRFIYPVLPFILIYLVSGIQSINAFITSKDRSTSVLTIIVAISLLFSFRTLYSLPKTDGPYSSDARSAFNYIRNQTPKDAIILFSRARALNLYAERHSTFLVQHRNEQENFAILKKIDCDYLLYADERSGAFNQDVQDFVMINKAQYDTIFKVDRFLLLKMKSELLP